MLLKLSSLWSDRTGNFAILFSLLLVPLLLAVGVALDYTRASSEKQYLMSSADAAALGALSSKSPTVLAAIKSTINKDSGHGSVQIDNTDALNIFNGQYNANKEANVKKLTIRVWRAGTDLHSDVMFKATIPTTFLKLVGINEIAMSGEAKALSQLPLFASFHMLLDNTPSMGVGATLDDIAALRKATARVSKACAFACHDESNARNNYKVAKKFNLKMRIDVVREAVQQLTRTAQSIEQDPNQFKMGIDTFGKSLKDPKLTKLVALSSDLGGVRDAAQAIDLMTVPKHEFFHGSGDRSGSSF